MHGWLSDSAQEDRTCPIITLKKLLMREQKMQFFKASSYSFHSFKCWLPLQTN